MKLVQREANGSIAEIDNSLINRVFSKRGINKIEELGCELKQLHSISQLKGIETAVDIIVEAFHAKNNILIVGDFDADGATSTVVAIKAFELMGFAGEVDYLVPNRFEYGYGLTPEIVKVAAQYSPDIIITVDNGISSIDGVLQAKSQGYKVIVTDHHLPAKNLPDADAIINPNQYGDTFPSKNLAGVGVIFYLMLAVKTALQKQNYFDKNQINAPNLTGLLDLVALGTVADVVPLDQNNRILVEQGLRRMRSGQACAGVQALFKIAKRSIHTAVSTDLGFTCGPRLNAAGRLDDMSLGIECLLSKDMNDAMEMASALDDLNVERRAIEEEMKSDALILMDELDEELFQGELPEVICLYKDNWHQGVIGILAARIREKYHRPTIIFAPADEQGAHYEYESQNKKDDREIKGSARSIPTIHIRDVLDTVASQNEKLLEKFGGHAMAAGLTLNLSQLKQFENAICEVVRLQADNDTFQELHYSDGELLADDFELNQAEALRYAAPWGQHFPAPVFNNHFTIINKRLLKDKHYKLILKPLDQSRSIAAIAFNVDIEQWPEEGESVHLLYRLEVNEFRDTRSLQLMVDKLL
ncbi:MAG: single-stranded-DNA-specific exonuclease [Cocleimonas sp.]|jgi:single-stranded-DNA-specific exonuclease